MRCIICDRCGKIIDDQKQIRVVTCARPIHYKKCDNVSFGQYRGDSRQMNDIMWEAELCGECVIDLETFMENDTRDEPTDPITPPSEGDDTGDTGETGETGGETVVPQPSESV